MTDLPLHPAARASYDAVSRRLHWFMAALIALAFVLGLTIDAFPKDWKPVALETHKIAGIAALLLLIVRFGWRLTHRMPAQAESPAVLALAARAGHAALYVLMLIVPVIGLIYAIRRGQGFDFGLFSLPPLQAPEPRAVIRPLRERHEWAAYALIALAGLHTLAALWHHFVRKDDTLQRMLPEATQRPLKG
ncbi:cytochrome b [Bosea sp. (in: a-proteobacteria)]|uniref:cytochrome b n=1 Tax=Bosea sp. (in: a-proteobacteria) TaxID=1871050 RepID=UPI00261A8162|nr:cytochrome b [Bosea sp. (in: a-proteobacteria)]MCO5092803.1 cytochrome b [Bosea sp. (in: a-proteobacteria)]